MGGGARWSIAKLVASTASRRATCSVTTGMCSIAFLKVYPHAGWDTLQIACAYQGKPVSTFWYGSWGSPLLPFAFFFTHRLHMHMPAGACTHTYLYIYVSIYRYHIQLYVCMCCKASRRIFLRASTCSNRSQTGSQVIFHSDKYIVHQINKPRCIYSQFPPP